MYITLFGYEESRSPSVSSLPAQHKHTIERQAVKKIMISSLPAQHKHAIERQAV